MEPFYSLTICFKALNGILGTAQLLFYVLVPLFAYLTFKQAKRIADDSIKSNKSSKIMEMTLLFHKRYDYLRFEAIPAELITKYPSRPTPEIHSFYERFWNLQFDQWEYSRRKRLDDEIYASWMKRRRDEYNSMNKSHQIIFNRCLKYSLKIIKDHDFESFISSVLDPHENIPDLIKKQQSDFEEKTAKDQK